MVSNEPMRHALQLVLAFAMVGALFAQSLPAPTPQNDQAPFISDPEEYAVYSALLNAQYATKTGQTWVIDDWTPSPGRGPNIGFVAGLAPTGAKRPDVRDETAADFETKRKQSVGLERKMGSNISYVLVPESELSDIFQPDANGKISSQPWQQFYEKYPGAQGIMSLSRVGFDKAKDEALVYVINQANLLGGSAFFYVLSKQQGVWKVKKTVLVWLS
jgi:hypothetical protein